VIAHPEGRGNAADRVATRAMSWCGLLGDSKSSRRRHLARTPDLRAMLERKAGGGCGRMPRPDTGWRLCAHLPAPRVGLSRPGRSEAEAVLGGKWTR